VTDMNAMPCSRRAACCHAWNSGPAAHGHRRSDARQSTSISITRASVSGGDPFFEALVPRAAEMSRASWKKWGEGRKVEP
jgi:hypothetical protein